MQLAIADLVDRLIRQNDGDASRAAEVLAVSTATLSRWRTGTVRPRKLMEDRLRQTVAANDDLFSSRPEIHKSRLSQLEDAIASTLDALREEFHKSASVTNRQEVLDLVSQLFFSHVVSIDNGGEGIGDHLLVGNETAISALNGFIAASFAEHLPQRWRRSFVPLSAKDERFGHKLLSIFGQEANAFKALHAAGRDDLINEVFSRFMSTSFVDEKEMGQYLTPPEIVKFMVELGIQALSKEDRQTLMDHRGIVLDPSCGVGSLLAETTRVFQKGLLADGDTKAASHWTSRFVSDCVVGFDKSDRMIRLAATNLALFGVSARKLYTINSLTRVGADSDVPKSIEGQVSLILTNPPFGATFGGKELSHFRVPAGRAKADSEILFLERYVDWLKPGGVVVSIVPDSILVNRGLFVSLREFLHDQCAIEGVFSLPSLTFSSAGTTTKTSIVLMRKRGSDAPEQKTYFGEAKEVGFDVVTRSGQRRRVRTLRTDLPNLLSEFARSQKPKIGRFRTLKKDEDRWDAPYHVGLPEAMTAAFENSGNNFIRVADVAVLVDDRADPKFGKEQLFNYIEISDVDIRTGLIGAKAVSTNDAPSRARKKVRAGDVLISTVRPERGAIGVVPTDLDAAICSTGFAVLRCHGIDPVALTWLLKSDFVRHQMVRNNIGIAYPAISEQSCLEIVLPTGSTDLHALESGARSLRETQTKFEDAYRRMRDQIVELETVAIRSTKLSS
jgi:type I restriction-modification system DNA methylase subunit